MAEHKIKAKKRSVFGRKVKALREKGILPANIYGKNVKSLAIEVPYTEFKNLLNEVGETTVISVDLNGKSRPVLIHDYQTHPVTDEILHVDFLQVDLKKKVKAQIPVELVGESPAEKSGLGTLVQHIEEVEVEALPSNLPDKFEVDVSVIDDLEKVISVKNIKAPKGVEILEDSEKLVAKVEEVKEEKEEEVEQAGEETEEQQTDGEEKSEEGGSEKESEDEKS